MKKYIYLALLLLGGCIVTACSNHEYDLQNIVPSAYHKIAYVKNYGTHQLSLFTTQTETTDSLILIKAGSDPSATANYRIKVLSQAELDEAYSHVQAVNYKLIPASAFSFDNGEDIAFAANETGKYFPVTFKPIEIFRLIKANPDVKYVLPLQLVSTTDSVNAEMNRAFYVLDVKSPIISFSQKENTAMMIYKSLDVSIPLTIRNCDANKWDISCTLDAADNVQAAANYNTKHGTHYDLLPDDAYTLDHLAFSKGSLTTDAALKVNRAKLVSDHTYLLPLKIGSSSMGEGMQIDTTYAFVIIDNPRYATREIVRKGWKAVFCNNDNAIGGTDDNAGIAAIFDDKNNTFWHTGWQIPLASGISYKGVTGDDYDYTKHHGYHAFKGSRDANKTVFVLDLQTTHRIIGVGITQRQSFGHADFHEADVFVSNDNSFLFKPVDGGGDLNDYHLVALNHWEKLMSINVPHDISAHWFSPAQAIFTAKGVQGRFVKIAVKSSYRDQNVSLAEFRLKELISIDGEPVE